MKNIIFDHLAEFYYAMPAKFLLTDTSDEDNPNEVAVGYKIYGKDGRPLATFEAVKVAPHIYEVGAVWLRQPTAQMRATLARALLLSRLGGILWPFSRKFSLYLMRRFSQLPQK